MKIDDDTKQFIKLRLENNAPEVEDLSPIELREMRASMAAVPPEHQVQINHIKDITIKSENRDLKLREYSNNNNDDQNSKSKMEKSNNVNDHITTIVTMVRATLKTAR